ncbi:MAG: lipocalin family protein [Bacteroidota bacterium]
MIIKCSSPKTLQTVEKVDLEKYMGKWYEIAAFPQPYEKNCACVTAEYNLTAKGYVKVVNKCRKKDSKKWKSIKGKAFVQEGSENSKLKVQFFWPFRGDYYIIDLAKDYSYAVVGSPDRESLWVLGRKPEMEDSTLKKLKKVATGKGFDVNKLQETDQSCYTGDKSKNF